jgi:hypothetical protein
LTAKSVSIGMNYYLPHNYTGPYTTIGLSNPLIINLANMHMAYSASAHPDHQ